MVSSSILPNTWYTYVVQSFPGRLVKTNLHILAKPFPLPGSGGKETDPWMFSAASMNAFLAAPKIPQNVDRDTVDVCGRCLVPSARKAGLRGCRSSVVRVLDMVGMRGTAGLRSPSALTLPHPVTRITDVVRMPIRL